MKQFNSVYQQIIKEDENLPPSDDYVDNNEPVERPTVDNFFEFYSDIGMTCEMALDEAIENITEMIMKEVPENSRTTARIAVKKLWLAKIKDWKSY
jgi:hypothetical protein